ncbi:MAG: DUF2208 family protein [Candidatus Marinimicrobia bacterium]|nr:DUF2208 family protein [Candidatus Neomarinimicrobiota bacterium]
MEFSKIKNKQQSIARTFIILSVAGTLITVLPFIDGLFLSGRWALVMVGLFFTLSCFIVARMFTSRALKLEKLKSGEKLLAHLELDDRRLQQYAESLRQSAKEKNKTLMWTKGIMFVVISIPFLFFMEADEMAGFLGIIASVVLILFLFSRLMPIYDYRKNLKGDKQILIGEKYAYFNGYFHNWDFPLSGLVKIKVIEKPFKGLDVVYYYTTRTLRNTHEIQFPIPDNFDPDPLISQMKKANRLK